MGPASPVNVRTRRATTLTREGRLDVTNHPPRSRMPHKARQAVAAALMSGLACLVCLRNAQASMGLEVTPVKTAHVANRLAREPLKEHEIRIGPHLSYRTQNQPDSGYVQLILSTPFEGRRPPRPPPAPASPLEVDDISFIMKTGNKVAGRLASVQATWLSTVSRVVYVSDREEIHGGTHLVRLTRPRTCGPTSRVRR